MHGPIRFTVLMALILCWGVLRVTAQAIDDSLVELVPVSN